MFVKPAYGRSYKSEIDLRADWESGKDFKIRTCPSAIGSMRTLSLLNGPIPDSGRPCAYGHASRRV